MRILWLPEALTDLERLYDFLVEKPVNGVIPLIPYAGLRSRATTAPGASPGQRIRQATAVLPGLGSRPRDVDAARFPVPVRHGVP